MSGKGREGEWPLPMVLSTRPERNVEVWKVLTKAKLTVT